jgi:uncharacterized protein
MSVSLVTQTCVRPESTQDFARWQGETATIVATFSGFLEQRLMPPKPPLQVDWVILQRFATVEDAKQWLGSAERRQRLEIAAPFLMGRDDVHIVRDEEQGIKPSPASAVIATRVLPGKEAEYHAWERKIAQAQSRAPGLQGYRFEPPVPGVQKDYVAILRFDSESNLQAWLDSPERKKLVDEAAPLTEEFHARVVRTGFDQWFRDEKGKPSTASVWKMDMIVMLMLYPIVYWFGLKIELPIMMGKWGMPRPYSLFFACIISVALTGYLVPLCAGYLNWWLEPKGPNRLRKTLEGTALILFLYAAMVVGFWLLLRYW